MDTLLKTYREAEDRLTKAEAELEALRLAKINAVKTIFETHGPGPHTVDGETKMIIKKGETFFFKKHTPKTKA